MRIKTLENRIYFNNDEKSFLNLTIQNQTVKVELLKVDQRHRNRKLATNLFLYVLSYIKKHLSNIRKIELSPLPLGENGLSFDLLVLFYEKFGFIKRFGERLHEPYLMVKSL